MKLISMRRKVAGAVVAVAAMAAPLLMAVPAQAAPTVTTRVAAFSAGPTTVVKGKSITIKAQAQKAVGKTWAKTSALKAEVRFLPDGKGQKVRTVKQIVSNSTGAFATTVAPGVSGKWAIYVPAQGSAKASASVSTWVKVVAPAKPKPKPTSVGGSGYTCPVGYPIKANQNSGIYHIPGRGSYAKTNARLCFDTEASAQRAGYRRAKNI